MMGTRLSGNGGSYTGPLRMDEDYADKVTENTIERHRAHARIFSDWLADNNLHPEGAGDGGRILRQHQPRPIMRTDSISRSANPLGGYTGRVPFRPRNQFIK